MLISSDLAVLGTRYYHESGVPSCGALRQRKTIVGKSSIQGLSTPQQARSSGFEKGFSAGRREEGNNMQRVVSRHTALKFNQFLLVGLQPGTNSAAQSSYGWRRSLGFSRSFALQPMDSSVTSLIGNARVLGSLPGHSGRSCIRVGSSVPCGRPAITRRSFRESQKLVTRRSRQRSTSSGIGSSGDFSPQRLLECAVDVLRNFNEKVNSFFQQGGESGSRDFATAAEEKVLTSADNAAGENVAPELVDVLSEQPAGSEFEWRSALWEAEVLVMEEGEAASQSGVDRLGTDGDISQLSGSNFPESVLGEADVEMPVGGTIEETKSETVAGSPELQIPENGNVISTVPVTNGVPAMEIEQVEVSPVEESKADSRSYLVSLGTDANTSKLSVSDVPESALGEADVKVRADSNTEVGLAEASIGIRELGQLEDGNVVSTIRESSAVSSVEIEVQEMSSVEEGEAPSQRLGTDGDISKLGGSNFPESALGEADVEYRTNKKIEEAFTETITANGELEHLQIEDLLRKGQESGASFEEKEDTEVLSVISRSSDFIGLGPNGDTPQLSDSLVLKSAVSEENVEIRAEEKIEESATEEINASRKSEHLENGNVVSTVSASDYASDVKLDLAEISAVEESGDASRSGQFSVGSDGHISQSSSDVPQGYGLAEADGAVRAMTEENVSGRELEHPGNGDVVRTFQDSEEASFTEIKEVDIAELWNRRTLGHSSLEPSISSELRPWGFDEDNASVRAENLQPSIREGKRDVEIQSGDTKSLSDELPEQNARSEPVLGSSLVSVEIEAVHSSAPEINRADSKLKFDEQGYQRSYSEATSILEKQIQNTSANAQVETFERSVPQTQDGLDTKLYQADELAQQTLDSEPSPNAEPQSGNSFRTVDHEVGESSDGRVLGKDVVKNTASQGSSKVGESSSLEGQVVSDERGAFLGQSSEALDTIEKEILQNGSAIGGLLENDDSPTVLSVGSGEAGESSLFECQTDAGETSMMEVKPVSPDKDLSSDEFAELKRERDTDDAEVVSERQIQADRRTGSDSSMDDLAIQREISRLRSSIGHHAYLYHGLGNPVISDAAYDSLVKELINVETQVSRSEPKLNFLAAAQPSPDVLKVGHSVPMLSLASVQKEEEAYLWYQKLKLKLGLDHEPLRWVVEPKVDGLALSLRYEHGKLKLAATRGNGIQGEDVTHNAQRVFGIPLTIPEKLPGTESPLTVLEVRGEVYMSLKDFEEWNSSKKKAGEKPMSNPRNAAAGSMRLLSLNAGESRPLNFMAYSIAVIEVVSKLTEDDLETSSLVPKTQWEVLQMLKSAGFPVNQDNGLFESFESAFEYANIWRSSRESLEYEADGVVLKVDDLEAQAWLGAAGADPRWAIAWKFPATEAVSVLEGIDLTIGRSGAMIPNARFKPVELGGATISRASLHNFGHVKALGLCEGDHIVVQRAGDVIPQVVQVLEDLRPETAQPWSPPTECPTCGSKLTEISASAMVFCSNSTCESRHSRQVAHFAKTLISGLGSATLSRLEEELVKDPADFYNVDEMALSKVKGFGKQSAKKLLKAIEESKQQDVWLFIAALGIPRVGTNTAKELAEKFGSLQALLKSDLSGFKDVPGIGAATASCIFDWCRSEPNIELVRRLEVAGCKINGNQVIETHEKPDSEEDVPIIGQSPTKAPGTTNESEGEPDVVEDINEVIETNESEETPDVLKETTETLVDVSLPPTTPALSGKSIVITGVFGTMSRGDMKKLVTLHGGVLRTSVTSKTSFLLCGNRPGPLKVTEASRRGIEMLDLQSFSRLIGHTDSDIVN